jgi:hypothetical protein
MPVTLDGVSRKCDQPGCDEFALAFEDQCPACIVEIRRGRVKQEAAPTAGMTLCWGCREPLFAAPSDMDEIIVFHAKCLAARDLDLLRQMSLMAGAEERVSLQEALDEAARLLDEAPQDQSQQERTGA